MASKKPCCPAGAARSVRKLNIGGTPIGIAQLGEIIKEVSALGIRDEARIREELLKRVKVYNYVPSNAEEYVEAILKEYKKNR